MRLSRRVWLYQSALASSYLLPLSQTIWSATPAIDQKMALNTDQKLIVIMLRGAIDGLSVVAPYADLEYARLRPRIALQKPGNENGVLDLNGYFGLHPALQDLQPLWQQKKLAFIHASGSPDVTRSHFDAQDYLESGTPGIKNTPDGWLNRLLSSLPGDSTPTRAVSLDPVLPRILSGSRSVVNISRGNPRSPLSLQSNFLDQASVRSAFDSLYEGSSPIHKTYQDAKQAHQEIMASLNNPETKMADNGAPLPQGFPLDATRIAHLMRNDGGIQISFMSLGGWDTHNNQGNAKGQLANHLQPLGKGLSLLANTLGPVFDKTVIVVMSEFGRTAKENGTGGTDHGHGNVMWVLGGKVAGGKVYGDWQGLQTSQLHEQRDLPVTTDFRSVLSQISEQHLKLNDAQLQNVFPQMPKQAIPFNLFA